MRNPFPRFSWLPALLVATALLSPSVQTARANDDTDPTVFGDGIYKKFGLDLGDAGRTHRFAIFTYGAGTSSTPFTALDVSATSSTTQFGYQIMGDIAMAGAYSKLVVSGYGSVSGDRYERTSSTESKVGSNAVIAGSRFSSSSIDNAGITAIAALKNVSTTAAGFNATSGSPTNISLNGASMTFSNNPFGGKYVMKLTNFVLDNHSTLTLNGAAGSAFVINVSTNFSLNNGSKILLTGGLTPSDVLFNVTGGSGTFSIAGDSLLEGTLLAYNSATNGAQRTLTISGSNTLVRGEIIANKVVVTDGGKVRKPKKKSKDKDDDDDEHTRKHRCD